MAEAWCISHWEAQVVLFQTTGCQYDHIYYVQIILQRRKREIRCWGSNRSLQLFRLPRIGSCTQDTWRWTIVIHPIHVALCQRESRISSQRESQKTYTITSETVSTCWLDKLTVIEQHGTLTSVVPGRETLVSLRGHDSLTLHEVSGISLGLTSREETDTRALPKNA